MKTQNTQKQESSVAMLDGVNMSAFKRESAKLRMQRCETLVDGVLALVGRKSTQRSIDGTATAAAARA